MSRADDFAKASRSMAEELAAQDRAFDFSVASLEKLDARLRAPGVDVALARAAGAYLAEVVIRRAPIKLRWVEATVLPGGAGPNDPFVLATPKNLVVLVLGKPRRRATDETEDTLMKFASAVQELCSREATSVGSL